MDTVGWDAKGDWGCSRAAEKDKKAPAAPPARSFAPRLPVSQTLLGALVRGRDVPDVVALTQSPSRKPLSKCPVKSLVLVQMAAWPWKLQVRTASIIPLVLCAAAPYPLRATTTQLVSSV
ncbi:hypothetical protein PpBr36_05404, partial [Pyricularia pennisetigena]|uniref:hypothetical protein n=1 Tax=Pyricularia pennisetigena TaxID=1578925 RepID=UPI0011531764